MTRKTRVHKYLICISVSISGDMSLIGQPVLFPGLQGEELQEALRDNYRPAFTLTLSQAKDTLYTIIDNAQDSVEGIYSGYKLFLPDGVDASQWLFMNGSGINLEHVYPQSKGADEGMAGHSDMHHLYPTRVAVNEARASFPFAEIPDNSTAKWFRFNQVLQTIPSADIDAYSEYVKGAFEPRESVKGNIARAVFYFYTMYQEDAEAADPDFFPGQRTTLCQWHLDDPVDETELVRSAQIADYQDGKENPFALDCTAALRAWCPEYQGCTTSSLSPVSDPHFQLSAYVIDRQITVRMVSEDAQYINLNIYDMTGRIQITTQMSIAAGFSEYTFRAQFASGIYVVSCMTSYARHQFHLTRCVVH